MKASTIFWLIVTFLLAAANAYTASEYGFVVSYVATLMSYAGFCIESKKLQLERYTVERPGFLDAYPPDYPCAAVRNIGELLDYSRTERSDTPANTEIKLAEIAELSAPQFAQLNATATGLMLAQYEADKRAAAKEAPLRYTILQQKLMTLKSRNGRHK